MRQRAAHRCSVPLCLALCFVKHRASINHSYRHFGVSETINVYSNLHKIEINPKLASRVMRAHRCISEDSFTCWRLGHRAGGHPACRVPLRRLRRLLLPLVDPTMRPPLSQPLLVPLLVLVLIADIGSLGVRGSTGETRDPDVPPLDWRWKQGKPFWGDSDRAATIVAGYYKLWATGRTPSATSDGHCPYVGWTPLVEGVLFSAFKRILDPRDYLDEVRTPLQVYDDGQYSPLLFGLVAEDLVSHDGSTMRVSWYTPGCGGSYSSSLRPFAYAVEVANQIAADGDAVEEPRTFRISADVPCGTRYAFAIDSLEADTAVRVTVTLTRATLPGPVGPETFDDVDAASVSVVATPRIAPSKLSTAQIDRGRYEDTYAKTRMNIAKEMDGQFNVTSFDAESLGMHWAVPVDVNNDGMLDIFAADMSRNTYKIFMNTMEWKRDGVSDDNDNAVFEVILDQSTFSNISSWIQPWNTYWGVPLGRNEVLILAYTSNVIVRFPEDVVVHVDEFDPTKLPLFTVDVIDEIALNGSGTWWAEVNDFNGDGLDDIFFVNEYAPQALVLNDQTANGTRSFVPVPLPANLRTDSPGGYSMSADFNGDGFIDIYVAHSKGYHEVRQTTLTCVHVHAHTYMLSATYRAHHSIGICWSASNGFSRQMYANTFVKLLEDGHTVPGVGARGRTLLCSRIVGVDQKARRLRRREAHHGRAGMRTMIILPYPDDLFFIRQGE